MKHALIALAAGALLAAPVLANQALAEKKKCTACHTVTKKFIGPSYQDVAARYAGQNASRQLADKIIHGSSNVWGVITMPPNPKISRTEAEGIRMRLANLETWRAGDVDPWRLRLTGVADTNGRMGRLDARVDELRKDVGTSEERRDERAAIASMRSDRKRVVAALVAAATIAGGGLYTIRDRYDASVEARGADTQWRKGIEKQLDTLFSLFGLKPPTSGATP